MAKRTKRPAPIVRFTRTGLAPVSGYDAELIQERPVGTEYDLVERSRRSNPHHALYWKTLTQAVNATGRWPTAAHLHDDLKWACGYRRQMIDMDTGEVHTVLDSIAFDAMIQSEFANYFKVAMAKLSEALGYDPLMFREDAA